MFTGVLADEKTRVEFHHPQSAARSVEFQKGSEVLSISFTSDDLLRKLSLDILRELTGKSYAMCDGNDCNHVLPVSELTTLGDGSLVCQDCVDGQTHKCFGCGKRHLESLMEPAREAGEWLCKTCADETYVKASYGERDYDFASETGVAL